MPNSKTALLFSFPILFLFCEAILVLDLCGQQVSDPTIEPQQPSFAPAWHQLQDQIGVLLPKVIPSVVAVEGGSGVIVNEQGIVITAAHVAGTVGRRIEVQLFDGRKIPAETVGANLDADVAVLKLLSPGPWPAASISGDSQLERGQWCLSLGYPSSYPRDRPAAVRIGRILRIDGDEIVTDCPIMGGDSGGPLVSLDGQVIGINRRVKNVITQNNHVKIDRQLADSNAFIAAKLIGQARDKPSPQPYLGLRAETDQSRVRVRTVREGGPADKAGLKPEDVILIFDDLRIRNFDQILQRVKQRRPGDQIGMVINRSGELIRLSITVGTN